MSNTREIIVTENDQLGMNVPQARKTNALVNQSTSLIEHIDLAAIWALFLHNMGRAWLEEIGKFFLFPLVGVATVIQAICAARQAVIAKPNESTSSILKAGIEIASAIAITTVIAGSLITAPLFVLAAPITFVAVNAAKALFNIGSAIYYGVKAALTNDPEKKSAFRGKAIHNAVSGVIGTLATIAITGVMLFGKFALAIAGIVASVGAIGYIAYSAIKTARKPVEEPVVLRTETAVSDDEINDTLSAKSTPNVFRKLNIKGLNDRQPLIAAPASERHRSQVEPEPTVIPTFNLRDVPEFHRAIGISRL